MKRAGAAPDAKDFLQRTAPAFIFRAVISN
jgi:hypothetical protein